MKFENKHIVEYDLIKTEHEKKCIECSEPTSFIDSALHLPVCSEECYKIISSKLLQD